MFVEQPKIFQTTTKCDILSMFWALFMLGLKINLPSLILCGGTEHRKFYIQQQLLL